MANPAAVSYIEQDVLIIGSGISGINFAYRLQEAFPVYTYAILESRSNLGGTWSLFKYPGVRSDADLYTYGFPWDPWVENRAIADGPSILRYLRTVAGKHGIDKHIKYGHKALSANWDSGSQRWRVEVTIKDTEKRTFYTRFLISATGYYDYEQGLNATIPGIETFKGQVVHPQFWPESLDYSGKSVVVIGSGATAVTLVPAMTEGGANRVTMLQRTPSYFITFPLSNSFDSLVRKLLPQAWAFRLIRLRFLLFSYLVVACSRFFPNATKKHLRRQNEMQLPSHIPYDPHFVPSYEPWDQRMCITPGGDFFSALRTGRANLVTDHIDTVRERGIKLKSGTELDADIIVTATGLKMLFAGGIRFSVDGKEQCISDKHVWHGALLQDFPNFGFIFGYADASWTLGADSVSQLIVRLLKDLHKRSMTSMVPRIENPQGVKEAPWLQIKSGYIKAAMEHRSLPKGGDVGPWKPRGNYFIDNLHSKWGDITTGLVLQRFKQQ